MPVSTFQAREARDFVRTVIARTKAPNHAGAVALAERRWGRDSQATMLVKAGVPGGSAGGWGGELVQPGSLEFMSFVRPMTILGQLGGLRRVPPDVPVAAQLSGAVAFWTGAGKATPLSRAAFERARLRALRTAALIVVSEELLDSGPEGEELLTRDLAAGVAEGSDRAFIDPANAGVPGEMPAAITHDAPSVVSVGDLAADLSAASSLFDGRWTSASLVMHPMTALQIALSGGGLGLVSMVGPRGGEIATVPVVCSESVPFDSNGGLVALIDASSVVVAEGGASIAKSAHGAIEMSDSPSGDAGTPAGSTTLVSLFQTDSVALMADVLVNWRRARPGSVVTITGANYGQAS